MEDYSSIEQIHIDQIRPNPYQPRNHFDIDMLNELAESIKIHGILQPIVVRPSISGYDIVAGERRFRAAQIIGNTYIPAIVRQMDDEKMMELAIIENLQREDLSPIEEAISYERLIHELNVSQQEVAKRMGKSRPYIANMMRLLKLPESIKKLIEEGQLSGAHGRTLLPLEDDNIIESFAKESISENWSVRKLEKAVDEYLSQSQKRKSVKSKPEFIQRNETRLKDRYGTNVEIKIRNKKGYISLEFTSEKEFKRIMNILENKI